jgi:hypothetical protein
VKDSFLRKDHADRTAESRVRRAAAYDLVFDVMREACSEERVIDVPAESTRRMRTANGGKLADLASDNQVAMKERPPAARFSSAIVARAPDDADAAPEIARRFRPLGRMLDPLIAHLRRRRGLI